MSACLIFQRPDICSTTSLESIRTCDLGGRVDRERRPRSPAISPRYSATLFDCLAERLGALGEQRAGVGVADEGAVAGDPRVAARPAVGLDGEPAAHSPDSAVRTRMRRHSSQRSTSSSGRRADPLDLDRVQLELAPAAAALAQRGGPGAAVGARIFS